MERITSPINKTQKKIGIKIPRPTKPNKNIENKESQATVIVFHIISLTQDIDHYQKIFSVKYIIEDIKGDFEMKGANPHEIKLNMQKVNSDFKFSVNGEEGKYVYSCVIYGNKVNHLYYSVSEEKYNISFYLTNYIVKEDLIEVDKKPIEITWKGFSQSFEPSSLSTQINYMTFFNVSLNFKCFDKQFTDERFDYPKVNNIKFCLYLRNNKIYNNTAFEIKSIVEDNNVLDDIKKEALTTLNTFKEQFYIIINSKKPEDFEKSFDLKNLIFKFKNVPKLPYFQKKLNDITNFDENDFVLYCDFLIYKTVLKAHSNYQLMMLRYDCLLDIIKTDGEIKSIENLKMICFKYSLIKKNILTGMEDKDYIKMALTVIPVELDKGIITSNKDEALQENDNYTSAINFLLQIVYNLTEKSALYELLTQFNSPISTNILSYKNHKAFELTYIPLEDIQNHLEQILYNTHLVRYNSVAPENGVTNHLSGFVGINELQLLNNGVPRESDSHSNIEKIWRTILSLVMVLLNEMFGHCKIKFHNHKNKTPPKYNKKGKICEFNDNPFNTTTTGESGRFLETIISSQNIIDKLKHCEEESFAESILNIDLWIDTDFIKLNELFKNEINVIDICISNKGSSNSQDSTIVKALYNYYDEEDFCHWCS